MMYIKHVEPFCRQCQLVARLVARLLAFFPVILQSSHKGELCPMFGDVFGLLVLGRLPGWLPGTCNRVQTQSRGKGENLVDIKRQVMLPNQ